MKRLSIDIDRQINNQSRFRLIPEGFDVLKKVKKNPNLINEDGFYIDKFFNAEMR